MIKKLLSYPNNMLMASVFTVFFVFFIIDQSVCLGIKYQVITNQKLVAITVDDGPDPRYTPLILDVLEKYKVPATFFVVGRQVELYPEIFRRELKNGNEVGNHSYSHRNLPFMSEAELDMELAKTDGIISQFTGKTVKWFRPPRGYYNRNVVRCAEKYGLRTILWSKAVETNKDKTAEAMAKRLINGIRPGGIILMHDGRLDRTRTVQALPMIIEGLQKKGYRFVTVSRLLELEKRSTT